MTRPLIIRPAAEADIETAYRWYEDQRVGLGAEFLSVVEAGLSSIERNPERYPERYKRARRLVLRRFPYSLFFLIQPALIEVIACTHGRRNPRHWRSRL